MSQRKWKKCVADTALPALVCQLALCHSAIAAAPPVKPNAERYHVKPGQKATGRAGSATLEARALVAKDRSVLLEVSTGVLDVPATPRGTLSKVALMAYDSGGRLALNRQYNGLTGSGYRSWTFSDLVRGQPFQVMGSIRAVDGARTDIVTVSGTTLLRPDLELAGISAPGRARLNVPVFIAAYVRETNGDVGATGDCVLLVDGAEADRARGIWIDAGGFVSCAFMTQFATSGRHAVSVMIANQVPADFEPNNNSLSAEVQVGQPGELSYWASASRSSYENSTRATGSYDNTFSGPYDLDGGWSDGGTIHATGDWSNDYGSRSNYENASLSAYSPTPIAFPVDSIQFSLQSGSNPTESFTFENVSADWSWGGYSGPDAGIGGGDGGMPPPPPTPDGCAYRYSTNPSLYLSLCTNSGGTNVSVNRYAGEAVYWSSGMGRSMITDGINTVESTWSYNEVSRYSDGTPLNLSGTCSMDLQIRDNGALYRANPTVQLYGSTYDYTSPWSCYEYSSPPDYYQRTCSESVYRYTSAYGYAYSN